MWSSCHAIISECPQPSIHLDKGIWGNRTVDHRGQVCSSTSTFRIKLSAAMKTLEDSLDGKLAIFLITSDVNSRIKANDSKVKRQKNISILSCYILNRGAMNWVWKIPITNILTQITQSASATDWNTNNRKLLNFCHFILKLLDIEKN